MVESIVFNPKDKKITNYFGEIKEFLRSMCLVNTNNKKQMGVGGVGETIKVFIVNSDSMYSEIHVHFRSDRCYLYNILLRFLRYKQE